MNGKYYNRSVYCHKVMFEALERLRFKSFHETLTLEEQERMTMMITELREKYPDVDLATAVSSSYFQDLSKNMNYSSKCGTPKALLSPSYIRMTGKIIMNIIIIIIIKFKQDSVSA